MKISLTSFIDQADSFNSGTSDVDVVKQYLQLCGNGKELLQLIKVVPTVDTRIAVLIMKFFCHILLRVSSDLNAFVGIGTSIANEFIANGMKSVMNFLKIKQKPSRSKAALHLLTCMIALGKQIAHQVVTKLNFSNITFSHLLSRKNFSEEEDIRTAFINLVVLIMTTCDFLVIRQLVDVKGFFNDILYGLPSDRPPIIVLVLSTFRELIVQNMAISKTTKIKIFNDHSLKRVVKLFSFKGPLRYDNKQKRKLGEEHQTIAYEATEEEIKNVKFQVNELMMSLCCSFRTGIIFHDTSIGSSGRNHNHVLTNILAYMPKPHTDKMVADFIIEVLKICPDQMVYYLPCLKVSCVPRRSSVWVDAVSVLIKIIQAQDPISCLFEHEEKKSVSRLITIAKSICFPNLIAACDISKEFQNGDPLICYNLCGYVICVLNKVKSITDFCLKADTSKLPYSAADLSVFNQSFLTTVFQDFSFMKDLEDYWEKRISTKDEAAEEKNDIDIPLPPLFDELSKVLKVMQQFLFATRHGYYGYEVNVPKLFKTLKSSHSSLSHEEICSLNIKIVDIIAAQGEEAIMLWNKSLIDSPLMVLLDVYLTSPSENTINDVSLILYKVLVHTKIFDFCSWETDIWLESMKSSKSKYVPFIIEFINSAVCSLLHNPNMFSDDIIETTFGKGSSHMSMDITSTLNDLLSIEKDPVVIENFEESSSVSSTPNVCFSSLVPAALYTLKSVDESKRKGCQTFVGKVLLQTMHHQQTPEILFSVIQKYSDNIPGSLYRYFELLCSSRHLQEGPFIYDMPVECKTDFGEHLMMKFISLHALQSSTEGCHCDIECDVELFGYKYKEKIIWQLMTYFDWEVNLYLEGKIQETNILKYISLLDKLLNSLYKTHGQNEIEKNHHIPGVEDVTHNILENILNRTSVLKLFLWTEKMHKSKRSVVKKVVNNTTKLVLDLIEKTVSVTEESRQYLVRFKEKVIKFNPYYFQTVNLPKNVVMLENPDICHIIRVFSTVYSSSDVVYMLEDMLNLETGDVKIENYFSSLLLVFKMYIELKDFVLLSPKAMNSLFVKYAALSKKQKKIMNEHVLQMFEKHPMLASVVNENSCLLLLKQLACKNFYVLGCLIDCNNNLRRIIQSAIIENLDDLTDTPDFIYLVSKCILNSTATKNEHMKFVDEDVRFLETVGLSFWEKISSHILIEVATPDMLLESSGSGLAVQVMFRQKLLNGKKILKYFRNHNDILTSALPSSSKILILLQFMEALTSPALESSKSTKLIVKLVLHWLVCAISSFESVADFSYFPLVQFCHKLFQSVPEVNMADLVETDVFSQKMLKVAMKHKGIGCQLLEILNLLCLKSQNYEIPAEFLFNLVTGHSNFFNIMLSQIIENENWKESVVDLLITLVDRNKSLCQDNHVGLILSSYTGSLKAVDRKLLYLIKLYSESDIDFAKFSPFLWSKTAVVQYSVMNNGNNHLFRKPSQQDLLSIFSLDMLEATAEQYPLTLSLEPSLSNSNEELKNISNLDKIYDLRFFLPLFANLLSPGSFVHCKNFMDSKVLALIFSSLSSFDVNTRALGYYCLSQLYSQLEGSSYREKEIWLSLLDSLRNSLASENPRIPSIVSLFLARSVFIFNKPDHPLYTILYKFILIKPNLDIGQVPEFYKLFNSLEIEYRIQRMWLLKLLSDGLRSSVDFHVCEKRFIFSTFLTYYWSSISTPEEKVEVLNVISAAVKVDNSAWILSQGSILSWLDNIIETIDSTDTAIVKSLCPVFKNLWFTTKKYCNKPSESSEVEPEDSDEKIKIKSLYMSFPAEFKLVLLNFLNILKILDAASLKVYLSTLEDVLNFVKNCDFGSKTPSQLSVKHISQILDCWEMISLKREKHETAKNTPAFQQLCELFSSVILLWSPTWKSSAEVYYNMQLLCVLRSVEFMLNFRDESSAYSSNLPGWLYRCFKEDKSHELVKLFLSLRGETCLRLILDFYEKSLTVSGPGTSAVTDSEVLHSKKKSSHQCLKILLHLKKICKNCNLTPDLNLYHQVAMIL